MPCKHTSRNKLIEEQVQSNKYNVQNTEMHTFYLRQKRSNNTVDSGS